MTVVTRQQSRYFKPRPGTLRYGYIAYIREVREWTSDGMKTFFTIHYESGVGELPFTFTSYEVDRYIEAGLLEEFPESELENEMKLFKVMFEI